MKTRRRRCTHRRTRVERRPMVLSSVHLNAVRGTVAATAARLPYMRRAAANAAIDFLRRQGTQKRSLHRYETFDLVRTLWQPLRTPEEIFVGRRRHTCS